MTKIGNSAQRTRAYRSRPNAADWTSPTSVLMTLPALAGGGRPVALLSDMGLTARIEDQARGMFRVIRSPHLRGRRPVLIAAEKIAGHGVPNPQRARLAELVSAASIGFEPTITAEDLQQQIDRIGDPREPVDVLAVLQMMCAGATDQDFPDSAISAYRSISSMRMKRGGPAFPDASVHIFAPAPALHMRAKLPSLLIRFQSDERLVDGEHQHLLKARNEDDKMVFASSQALVEGVHLFDVYLGPLLGALSPAIWGFAVPRTTGVTIFSLGSTLNGRRQGLAAEPLQLLATRDRSGTTDFPQLKRGACSAAISWWQTHLENLFHVVNDPLVFADQDGHYRAARHLQCLASVEQVFRLTHSIQTAHRDSVGRRILMHSVVDTFEGLFGYSSSRMFELSFAQRVLDDLRAGITHRSAQLVLNGAERAVAALAEMQRGFFLPQQLGRTSVVVPGQSDLPFEAAVSQYTRVLRNGTHGYGGKTKKDQALAEALLANHDGEVPHDLPLIAYLYLLHMLTHPQTVGRNVSRRAAS